MKIIIKHLKQTFSVNLTLAAFVKIISERFVVPCAGTDKGSPEGGGEAEKGRPGKVQCLTLVKGQEACARRKLFLFACK